MDEIVWVHPNGSDPNTDYQLDVYKFDEGYATSDAFKVRTLDTETLSYSTVPRAFNLALGDFTGESLPRGAAHLPPAKPG